MGSQALCSTAAHDIFTTCMYILCLCMYMEAEVQVHSIPVYVYVYVLFV